jgi:hypothetical protein
MHLATATPHTGFINIADTPHQELLARKWKVPRDSRAVSFHTNKHIPPKLDKNFLDASKKAKSETAHYCFKFRRYICTDTCRGIAVANRRQMMLSRKRILALSVAEYVHLRGFTVANPKKPDQLVDRWAFEKSWSLIFNCFQYLTKQLVKDIRGNKFPVLQCLDEEPPSSSPSPSLRGGGSSPNNIAADLVTLQPLNMTSLVNL